jgi:twitching motility protein PilT
MASKVEALVRSFLKTDGDALCLTLGERMYLKRGSSNTVVGREPLSQESFRAIADELAPGDLLESLVETAYKVPFRLDDQSEPVQIDFSGTADTPAMTIVRARTQARPAPSATAAATTGPPTGANTSLRVASTPTSSSRATGPAAASPASIPLSPAPVSAPEAPTDLESTFEAVPGSSPAARQKPGSRHAGHPIDRILLRMIERDASDVHLSSDNVPMFRVHGEITPQEEFGIQSSDAVGALIDPIFPPRNRAEFDERSDTDFAYEIEGVARFRVNVFRDRKGVGAVLRQIPFNIMTAQQLNLPPAIIALSDLSKGSSS